LQLFNQPIILELFPVRPGQPKLNLWILLNSFNRPVTQSTALDVGPSLGLDQTCYRTLYVI